MRFVYFVNYEATDSYKVAAFKHSIDITSTSNGGCRREEKSRKHWSFFTDMLSRICINLICINLSILFKNREKEQDK